MAWACLARQRAEWCRAAAMTAYLLAVQVKNPPPPEKLMPPQLRERRRERRRLTAEERACESRLGWAALDRGMRGLGGR